MPVNWPPGIGVDLEIHRRADRNRRDELLGNRQLHAQRIDAHHDGDLDAFGDVVARRDETLSDQSGKRRAHHRVGDRFVRERHAGAGGLQRLILLRRAVLCRFVLLPRRLHLRPALIELRLRDDPLVEQRADPVELVLCQLESRLGVLDFRDAVRVELDAGFQPEPRLDLRRIGLGFTGLGIRL